MWRRWPTPQKTTTGSIFRRYLPIRPTAGTSTHARSSAADFNQGLDARRIARCPEVAELLSQVRWLRFLRMAYDSPAVRDDVHRAVELLGRCGIPPRKLFFYVLVRDDIDDALRRIRELKEIGCVPFAQPYRDFTGGTKPSREAWRLAY